ncbi:MAG TPA: sulfatase-like hydrolase/transferase [bacterium]|nr:sulfatase-like hydrolase/transferase [bacterium]
MTARSGKLVLALGAAAALAVTGCAKKNSTARQPGGLPDVLFVTLDTFRADRAGCMGHPGGLTPHLDAALRGGLLASNVFAPAPLTAVSHATLLTGLPPTEHGVRENALYTLQDKLPHLAEILRAQGFHTAGFISGVPLERAFGFAYGFDVFDDSLEATRGDDPNYAQRSGKQVVDAVLRWLDAGHAGQRLFVWVHFFDAHHPRTVPAALSKFPAKDDYDREILLLDREVGRLLRELTARRGEPVFAVASDHGEALGDHGEISHGVLAYDETMRGLLGMNAPQGSAESARIGHRIVAPTCAFTDFKPTLLAALEIPDASPTPGRSILDASPDTAAVYGETYYANIHYGWSPVLTLRTNRWTYIEAPLRELYDRDRDPRERTNVYEQEPEVARRMAARLQSMTKPPDAQTESEMDAATQERLASLGYVAATSQPKVDSGKDPKKLISAANALFRGITLKAEGKPKDALPHLQRAYREDPENFSILYHLADCLRLLGDVPSAMSYYRSAIESDPQGADAFAHLAILTYENGHHDEAFTLLEDGLRKSPRSFALLMTSGDLRLESGDASRAKTYYQKAAEVEPKRADPWIGLAHTAEALGSTPEADSNWRRAQAIDPRHPRLAEARPGVLSQK